MDALKSAGRAIIRSPSIAKQSWGGGRHKSEYRYDQTTERLLHVLTQANCDRELTIHPARKCDFTEDVTILCVCVCVQTRQQFVCSRKCIFTSSELDTQSDSSL